MKYNPNASSSRRKSRKAHFTASSGEKRKLMSCRLSKELRDKYKVRSMPVVKGDEVTIMSGGDERKGHAGKVDAVYRLKNVVHVSGVQTTKANGQTVPIGLAASKLMITKLRPENSKSRLEILARRARVPLDEKPKYAVSTDTDEVD